MINYLSKYLVRLSDMTESLRRLDDKDVECQWTNSHTAAMDAVKKALTEAPVLRYYDVNKPVTTQCDASDTGLGAVLLQEGQPICYASRALTYTEKRYAQIEKELLGMLWSCDKFDQYIYGRDIVTIGCDPEPLKAVFKKDIHKSPKRLQRMCLVRYRSTTLTFSISEVHLCIYQTHSAEPTETRQRVVSMRTVRFAR